MRNLLHEGLLKAVKQKKDELEDSRKRGLKVRETDLPVVVAGCEYSDVMEYGFSSDRKHVKRTDIKPFDKLLENRLKTVCPKAKKIPDIIFKKKHNRRNSQGNMPEVLHFVGTCAEDNAANLILHGYGKGKAGKPTDLKVLNFDYPVRVRTFKRKRMCNVCRTIFTEP